MRGIAPAAGVPPQVGLKVLREDGRVLACYEDMRDTVFHAEVGASAAILEQGYTIDALMLRYQGTDWRNHSNWDCNAGYTQQPLAGVASDITCLIGFFYHAQMYTAIT